MAIFRLDSKSEFDVKLFGVIEDFPYLNILLQHSQNFTPKQSNRSRVQNIVTDYDDAHNTTKRYPYPFELYMALNGIL